ncbi:threonine ammonia-lyase [Phytomonospora endophytica]|uniref:Threonine dehydratase n=1 Tax=Phytomonospora endophytica TaxID=714109 RepID=A0A841FE73_9ACTN|nr:pyridoxal-phosphate dependent enzyme [Phytomonospora endophytica]MBB6033313.1 threonine dehydratase [Phytomonospora endophytica]GIG65540.1 threonine dehydratase [Phytomonospora endophytica]
MPTDLSLERIARAAAVIDDCFRDTPQYTDPLLSAALGRPVLVKVETANPLRSFKGRGAAFLVHELPAGTTAVVCASSGNFGQGVAHAGRRRGLPVHVFTTAGANPVKLARLAALDATITQVDGDGHAAKEAAREHARETPGAVFVEDGREPAIAEGAGTIGVELLRTGTPDTVVLPVGDGSLIAGVARWVKHAAPSTRIVGVGVTGAPALADSLRAGRVVPGGPVDTIAEGIAIRVPVAESVERLRGLVDEMVLVDDTDLLAAMRLIADTLGILVEPAGAAGIAAIARHGLGERPATVLTGANPRPGLLPAV